jgi:hypothetical protein
MDRGRGARPRLAAQQARRAPRGLGGGATVMRQGRGNGASTRSAPAPRPFSNMNFEFAVSRRPEQVDKHRGDAREMRPERRGTRLDRARQALGGRR